LEIPPERGSLKRLRKNKFVTKFSKSHKDLTPLAGGGATNGVGNNLFLSINALALE
jgi:hypothetical protein